MFKKLQFWSPLVVLFSIVLDAVAHYGDQDYLWICITAAIGWLLYWIALIDLERQESDNA